MTRARKALLVLARVSISASSMATVTISRMSTDCLLIETPAAHTHLGVMLATLSSGWVETFVIFRDVQYALLH